MKLKIILLSILVLQGVHADPSKQQVPVLYFGQTRLDTFMDACGRVARCAFIAGSIVVVLVKIASGQ